MRNKIVILIGILIMVLILFLIYGCGRSAISGNGGPTLISRLYLAGFSNEIIVFNPETLTTEASIFLSDATAKVSALAISKDKNTLYALDYQNDKLYSKQIEGGTEDEIDLSTYDDFELFSAYLGLSLDGARVFIPSNIPFFGIFSVLTSPFSLEAFVTKEAFGPHTGTGVTAQNDYAYAFFLNAPMLKYDIAAKAIIGTAEVPYIDLPMYPRFNPSGEKIYVPAPGRVHILNPTDLSFEASIHIPANCPIDVGFTSNGKAYVTEYDSNKIFVLNTNENTLTKTITDENFSGPEFIVVDEARARVYVNDADKPILSIIDMVTDTIVSTIELPSKTDQIAVK